MSTYQSYDQSSTTTTSSGAPPQRKRLQLKPRSVGGTSKAPSTSDASPRGGSSSNPFGSAKPREEVLANKGIDAKLIDERIQKKASVLHLTRDQELQVTTLQKELDQIQKTRREANEKELPEEQYRIEEEKKKKELNELMKEFSDTNTTSTPSPSRIDAAGKFSVENTEKGERKQFERPSERRKRMEQRKEMEEGGYGGQKEGYSSHW